MELKFFIYAITFVVLIFLSLYLSQKYKLTNYQKMIFCMLFLFWSANVIIRAYRKSYALNPLEAGGLALGGVAAANIAAAYGLSSFFSRFTLYALSDWLKSKKLLIALALLALMGTNLWVLLSPSYPSLYWNSFLLGVSASFISLFNVIFAQSFEDKEAMKSVSILSVAPLMAEFGMSTFQYHFTQKGNEQYPILWGISLIMALLAFFFLLFIKEKKTEERRMTTTYFVERIKVPSVWIYGILGVLVSFIKFSTSGSNLITYFQSDFIQMNHFMVAYSDFLFAMAQLVAGILAGLYFSRKWGLRKTLAIGLSLGLIFQVVLLTTYHAGILFFACLLSGFSYGLVYNGLIGLALGDVSTKLREMNMAIYQSFFALGIFYGDKVYALVWKSFAELPTLQKYQYVYIIGAVLSLIALGLLFLVKEKRVEVSLNLGEATLESLKED